MTAPIHHPLRGSEDELNYTNAQWNRIREFEAQHDEVQHHIRPDGTLHVETIDYEDNGYTETCHVVYRDGLVF